MRYGLFLSANSGLPWTAADSGRLVDVRIRAASRVAVFERWPRPFGGIGKLLALAIWPAVSFWNAVACCRAARMSALAGRSRLDLFWWSWKLALRSSVEPVEALAYRLYEPEGAPPSAWWYSLESASLSIKLCDQEAQALARDKFAFKQWCDRQELAAVTTLALASAGTWASLPGGVESLRTDLVVKPRYGGQGRDVEAWSFGGGIYRSGSRTLDPDAFEAAVLQLSAKEDFIVQPRVPPHPRLQAVAGAGVPILRVVTALHPSGLAELGLAMIQAPLQGSFVSQSGPFRLVDPGNGRIRAATPRQRAPVFETEETDAFEEFDIPAWGHIRDLLTRAHRAFPGRAPLVGWDVLIGRHGPVICEANLSLSYYMFQMADGTPMSTTPLAAVANEWLECLE